MLVTETPACGASSPVSFAASARLSCSRAASAAAALLSPVSIATRNSPKQWPADRLQSLDHAGAFLEQDAAHVPFAPQQLGRQCRAHLGRQVRLPVPPYRVVRHAKRRPRPAWKARWQLQDRSAAATGDCRSCSAALPHALARVQASPPSAEASRVNRPEFATTAYSSWKRRI